MEKAALRGCCAPHRVLGVHTVAAYSERDRNADYLRLADETRCIGPADPRRAISMARQSSQPLPALSPPRPIHPGDGPLAEKPGSAAYVQAMG